jgi:streptogramin lyase
LPACREEAENGMKRINDFIQKNKIDLFSISMGTYYPRYIKFNPSLLKKTFPEVSQQDIDEMLRLNFAAIGEVFEIVIKANPKVLFVMAAGSNYNGNIDENPAWYGNLSKVHGNVLTVTSTFDEMVLENGVNWGPKSVDVVINISGQLVPRDSGPPEFFTGTSAASPVATGMMSSVIHQFASTLDLTPPFLKATARTVAAGHTSHNYLKEKALSGGVLREKELLEHLAKWTLTKALSPSSMAPPSTEQDEIQNSSGPLTLQPVIKQGKFTLFTVPEQFSSLKEPGTPGESGRSCEQIRVDSKGVVWMTFPFADAVASFDPQTESWTKYPLKAKAQPDGLVIDAQDRKWFGNYYGYSLGLIESEKATIHDFLSDSLYFHHQAIPGVSKNGHIWVSSHQAKRIYEFDPESRRYLKMWPMNGEWPIDVIGDESDSVWVSIMNRLDKSDTGGLAHINYLTNEVKTYPLAKAGAYAFWLANDFQRYIYITASSDGLFQFDKKRETIRHIIPEGLVLYKSIAARAHGSQVAIGNSDDGRLSIDVFDSKKMSLVRYPLPIAKGMVKEGLDFGANGHLWGCQVQSNVIFRLDLSE